MLSQIHHAPPDRGQLTLGRTIPSLLDEACDRHPNTTAFNQWYRQGWQSWSNQQVRSAAEALALGLQGLGLGKGDRVALLLESDVNFCVADLACLLAGLVNVPIYLGEASTNVVFILQHSEAKALILSDLHLLCQVLPCLREVPCLKTFIVLENGVLENGVLKNDVLKNDVLKKGTEKQHPKGAPLPTCPIAVADEAPCVPVPTPETEVLPPGIQVLSWTEVQAVGQAQQSEAKRQELRTAIDPQDLATIVYITGATGQFQQQSLKSNGLTVSKVIALIRQQGWRKSPGHSSKSPAPVISFPDSPKGVMLTHENLSGNALAAFSSMPGLAYGPGEVVLSFLPLSHVFARTLIYGHIAYGHSLYFSHPNRIVKHLQEIQPTIFTTVPRLLEKVYGRILSQGQRLKGAAKFTFDWALHLAQQYQLGQPPHVFYPLQQKLADRLVFRHWRQVFGGRLKYLISGGAALQADIANTLSAAGIPVFQGYGLTEASAVVCFNRGHWNRAGTVGVPIPGVEVALDPQGEIWVRSPYVMQGFYHNPEATAQVLEPDGWLHTGDLGQFTPEGFLKITGCKKDLFKLSTGKYVVPLALERKVKQSPLVEQAIAVGAQRKFCSMLIFPNLNNLIPQAHTMGLDLPLEDLLQHPQILALYQTLVDEANKWLPSWSTVKLFRLINPTLSHDNSLIIPTLNNQREQVKEVFAAVINEMYVEG